MTMRNNLKNSWVILYKRCCCGVTYYIFPFTTNLITLFSLSSINFSLDVLWFTSLERLHNMYPAGFISVNHCFVGEKEGGWIPGILQPSSKFWDQKEIAFPDCWVISAVRGKIIFLITLPFVYSIKLIPVKSVDSHSAKLYRNRQRLTSWYWQERTLNVFWLIISGSWKELQ